MRDPANYLHINVFYGFSFPNIDNLALGAMPML